jgi:hypothetical protein
MLELASQLGKKAGLCERPEPLRAPIQRSARTAEMIMVSESRPNFNDKTDILG